MIDHESYYKNGTESSVNCSADGYPAPYITWFKNEHQIASGRVLYFRSILVSDAGTYQCKVGNVIGTKQDSVYVNVTCESFLFHSTRNFDVFKS